MDSGGQLVMKKEIVSEALDELIKEAHTQLADPKLKEDASRVLSENEKAELEGEGVLHIGGALNNSTSGTLQLHNRIKNWYGHFVKKPPSELKTIGYFYEVGISKNGCAAGVVYEGKSKKGVDCGWLVAWSDSQGGKKVYCDCGVIDKFKNLDWSIVKHKLDKSHSRSSHYDPETGTTSMALMSGTTTAAYVAADFSG